MIDQGTLGHSQGIGDGCGSYLGSIFLFSDSGSLFSAVSFGSVVKGKVCLVLRMAVENT